MNEAPRADFGGQDAGRQDSGRQDAPRPARANEAPPRRSRRRDERDSAGPAEDVAALPAFLMTPPRPVPVAEPAAQSDAQGESTSAAQDDGAPAPKPRRRRRARFEGSDGAIGSDDPTPVTE